jgi:D-glycero-D-manno-heptose 1,7-bisphosphate phosphatase
MTLTPAIFLDRDGVIIENRANYVRTWEDVEFFPQALTAMARLSKLPYKLIMVTNQSAVGRGIISLETAVSINNRVIEVVRGENGRIDGAYICPDAPSNNSPCRKPQPGMLLQAAEEHHINISRSIMVGDAITDLNAGRNAGVLQSVILLTGRGKEQIKLPKATLSAPFPIYKDLTAFVDGFIF